MADDVYIQGVYVSSRVKKGPSGIKRKPTWLVAAIKLNIIQVEHNYMYIIHFRMHTFHLC